MNKLSKMLTKIFQNLLIRIILYGQLIILIGFTGCVLGLKDVTVTVPTAVRRGDNAILMCNYDIENDTLYSVKWYKGKREFYRYTPKENPAMKIFPAPGITVEKALSNQSHVVLSSVQLNLSGKFSCEVSADAPTFHTTIVSGNMEIVEIPEQRPIITSIHSRYRLGDIINGNCSSDFSKPAANLTWTINDMPVPTKFIKIYDMQKNPTDNLESSVSEITFIVNHMHFIKGRLKLKCTAKIHSIYEQESDKLIEEDRPRILASGRSPDANLFPFDQQSDGDFLDANDLYPYRDPAASSAHGLKMNKKSNLLDFYENKNLNKYKKLNIGKFYSCILSILTGINFLSYISLILTIFLVNKFNSFLLVINFNQLFYFNHYTKRKFHDENTENTENLKSFDFIEKTNLS